MSRLLTVFARLCFACFVKYVSALGALSSLFVKVVGSGRLPGTACSHSFCSPRRCTETENSFGSICSATAESAFVVFAVVERCKQSLTTWVKTLVAASIFKLSFVS